MAKSTVGVRLSIKKQGRSPTKRSLFLALVRRLAYTIYRLMGGLCVVRVCRFPAANQMFDAFVVVVWDQFFLSLIHAKYLLQEIEMKDLNVSLRIEDRIIYLINGKCNRKEIARY